MEMKVFSYTGSAKSPGRLLGVEMSQRIETFFLLQLPYFDPKNSIKFNPQNCVLRVFWEVGRSSSFMKIKKKKMVCVIHRPTLLKVFESL